MATSSNESRPNLSASFPADSSKRRGGTKTFSRSPNPADAGVLGNVYGEPPISDPVNDKDALTEPALRSFFGEIFNMADNTRRPHELIWHQCWDLYNGTYDWSAKSWWQSRANIPKIRSSVDRAVSIFRKSLFRLQQFYQIQAESQKGKAKGQFTSELIGYWFMQSDVLEELVTSMKVGLITSVCPMKVWWQQVREMSPQVTESQQPQLKFGVEVGSSTKRDISFKEKTIGKYAAKAVDPFNIWVIPKTNRFAVIERFYITLNAVEAGVKKGIYRKESLDRIRNYTGPQTVKKSQEARRAGEMPTSPDRYIREIEGYHYWGDIYNTDGKIVMPDASFSLIGKEVLLRDARPNPFFHKRPPYIIGTPYTVPFSTYNRGMVGDVYEIAKEITELTNLMIDGGKYDALKAFAIDIDALDDPSETQGGMYPGKTFTKKGSQSPPGSKVVETVDVGRVPAEAMNTLNILERAFQEGTYINEWVSGQGEKGQQTLGEVNIKTQSALEGLDEAARNIEITVVEPLLAMSAKVIYQFHKDYSLSRLTENYPETAALLADLTPAERYAVMIGGYDFKARGLSVAIDQQQRLGEIGNFLSIVSHIPGLMQEIDPTELLEALMLPLNWNVEKLLLRRKGMPLNPNPMVPNANSGLSPVQESNAQAGAAQGGAINNSAATQAPGQGGQGGGIAQLLQMVMQAASGGQR